MIKNKSQRRSFLSNEKVSPENIYCPKKHLVEVVNNRRLHLHSAAMPL